MPGKRARRHFSQLSELERDLIIEIKTAGWSTRRVAGQVHRSKCVVRNCWEQWTREVTRSTIRADVGVAIVPQTISRHLAEENFKAKRHFRGLRNIGNCVYSGTKPDQCSSSKNVTDWQKVVFSDEFLLALETDDNRVRVWGPLQDNARPHTARVSQDFLRHFHPWSSHSTNLFPVEHVWDQLKRQVLSCHFVHDLELAVQDLWAHLLLDNIRCLFNSMPVRGAACIAAGGGPTRY
ncbi:transposable element Tcb2 transposase [Trichonephila clavipes]|nr:transposable element Tcb2 transposase [Trichonephila clavipes]